MKSFNTFDKIQNTKFDFVKHAWKFAIASLVIFTVGIIVWLACGLNLGLDFTGGTIVKIQIGAQLDEKGAYNEYANKIEDVFGKYNIEISQMQKEDSGENAAISVRFQDIEGYSAEQMTELVKGEITTELTQVLNADGQNTDFKVQESQRIGATASSDLLSSAILAILISSVLILIYIAFRFELLSGLATLVTIVHDVLIVFALVSIFRIEINSAFVAAIITIIGYSINNTIIIFDRVRENMNNEKIAELGANHVIQVSVKQTLIRSMYTTLTTLLAIAMLAIIGVSSIQIFLLPIIFGLIAGLYSSVFLAPALWCVMLTNYTDRMNAKGKPVKLSIVNKKKKNNDKNKDVIETKMA